MTEIKEQTVQQCINCDAVINEEDAQHQTIKEQCVYCYVVNMFHSLTPKQQQTLREYLK